MFFFKEVFDVNFEFNNLIWCFVYEFFYCDILFINVLIWIVLLIL